MADWVPIKQMKPEYFTAKTFGDRFGTQPYLRYGLIWTPMRTVCHQQLMFPS